MHLSDSKACRGTIVGIGCDADTHRRLVDMGLLGAHYAVTARRKSAVLVDYGDFSAVTSARLADELSVEER